MRNPESRTYKTIKNSGVALLFYAITFFLSFISRRILLKQLGADILGLNTTASSLLSFLNLAELGIGTAIAYTLYKPLREKDIQKINEIVSLQGWFYRRIALFIIGGSMIMMGFFPLIFAKSELPLWYAFASYSVLLFSSLLSYFLNYRQIVLSANQQNYKIQFSYNSISIIKVICQMIAVTFATFKYQWWLILEVIFTGIATFSLNLQIKRTFPELNTNVAKGSVLRKKYPDIITKTKQLFVHRISLFALTQTSPLIIYAFASLVMVTKYGNYITITSGLLAILSALFNSMNAGVGNLVSEGDMTRIMSVFRELFSSRFSIIGSICVCLLFLSSPFIKLWLGPEYCLDSVTVLIIVLLFYIRTSREVVDSYINAYGLFQDIWAPAAEAAINVGCSILFGWIWGLPGILGGVLLSQVLIILIWKPILLFTKGLKQSLAIYGMIYLKHLTILSVTGLLTWFAMRFVPIDPSKNYLSFFLYGFLMEGIALTSLVATLYATEQGMRDFLKRIFSFIKNK